jgi:2-(3-amino-3-carboxypropyl)histidine synthase
MGEGFDFEVDRIAEAVRQRECRTVFLQFPEGLKRRAAEVALALSARTDATVIVSGEPCFGACDIPETGADLIVHFGHLPIPNLGNATDVLYIQARSDADPLPAMEKALPLLESPVGLLTTAQHLHMMGAMSDFLDSKGMKPLVGKGDGRMFAEGQVLGCNASAARAVSAEANSFLFVGTGMFHPLAIALVTPKPVISADPVTGQVTDVADARDRMLRRRHAAIERARQARRVGIILSLKAGQRRLAPAIALRSALSAAGLDAVLVELDTVTPDRLLALGMDAWVSTACPRLAMDDFSSFEQPVLTVPEAAILLGEASWDDYSFDEIR